MHRWSSQHPQNHFGKINYIWKSLENQTEFSDESADLQKQLEEAITQNELYWQQRSRVDWLQARGKNTKIFHHKASARLHRNFITALKDQNGN